MKKLFCLLPLLLLLWGCQEHPQTQTAYYFDTVVSITLPEEANPALFDKAWALCRDYEQRLDRFSEESDLGRLAPHTPTTVDAETADLVRTALTLTEATDGAFDIRLGALSDLWHFEQDSLPDPQAVTAALQEAKTTTITLTDDCITLSGLGKPDLGGIAKGYVTDRLVDLFRQEGCTSAVLNLGGNVYCLGSKSGTPYAVGIDTLMHQPDPPILALTDQAAVTAGTTQRYKMVDGVRYHHILDPQTGMPAQSGLRSATIIADSATLADALSTACIVLGKEKAEELLKKFPDVSAVLVADDGGVTTIRNPKFVENAQK